MHSLLAELAQGLEISGEARDDATRFLRRHDRAPTAAHTAQVVDEVRWLADRFGVNRAAAETAAWFHDISAVFAYDQRLGVARSLGLVVLPEEEVFPMIVHQKISVVMARDIFGVADEAILSAIGCHTTLKADASALDKVVFVADKIPWSRGGTPPYLPELLEAADRSLDEAALVYLRYVWDRRDELTGVLHPWLVAAYNQLSP